MKHLRKFINRYWLCRKFFIVRVGFIQTLFHKYCFIQEAPVVLTTMSYLCLQRNCLLYFFLIWQIAKIYSEKCWKHFASAALMIIRIYWCCRIWLDNESKCWFKICVMKNFITIKRIIENRYFSMWFNIDPINRLLIRTSLYLSTIFSQDSLLIQVLF